MIRPAGVLEVDRILNVVQRRCDDLGVNVVFSFHAKTASTDGRTITLPYVHHPTTQEDLDRLYGYVIHECGHHLRPKAFDILNTAQPPEHLAALFNIIEDDGMERERAMAWLGDRKALGIMNEGLTRQFSASLSERTTDKESIKPLVAMLLSQMSRLEWDDYSQGAVSSLLRNLPIEVKELFNELENEGWVKKFRNTTTETDTWNVSVDLAKRLYPDNDQSEYESIRQAGIDGANGEGEPRDTSKDTMQQADGDKSKDEGEGNNSEEVDDTRVVSWRDVVLSDHDINKDAPPGGVAIDWEGYGHKEKAYVMPTNKINVIDLSRDRDDLYAEAAPYYRSSKSKWKDYMPTDAQAKQFANQVRRYIQSKARSVVVKEKYHGKIDRSALIRLVLPPIDGGEYNKRIFYDQRKHTLKDTAIFVLTDWSGSMIGTKMHYAADASQRLVYTFDRILNIPVALAAFSDRSSDCDVGYIKPYNTRGMSSKEIAERFDKFRIYSCGNNDSDAVHWAWQQILKRKESRKILMVLSDGAPTDSWHGHAHINLKFITKAIEKDGRVELYGIGIMSDAVKNYYTNYKVLNSAEEINNTLFNVIKEGDNVKRRTRN